MFGSFKDFAPPKVDSPYFSGSSLPQLNHQNLFSIPQFQTAFMGDGKQIHEQYAPSPIHEDSFHGKENFMPSGDGVLHESDSLNKPRPGRLIRQNPMNHFKVRADDPVQRQPDDYGKALTELTAALTQAVMDKSSLLAENASLKEKVYTYEEKLSQVESMFNTLMGRIAALEGKKGLAQHTEPRRFRDNSPKSPAASERSVRTHSQGPRARSRSVSATRQRQNIPGGSSRERSVTPSRQSAVVAARGRIGSVSSVATVQRSKSPARVAAAKPISLAPAAAPARPASPIIRYEVQIAYNDRMIAKAQLTPSMSQDGPFLYVVQSELKPPMSFVPASPSACAFTGLSISVVGTNTRTRKSNVVFKSHSSHVENPPVNEQDGYFSHSCWLSGPGASVVGGVRIFFRPTEGDVELAITLYAMSLKFWFPESSDEGSAPNFTKDHWKELLKLLSLL